MPEEIGLDMGWLTHEQVLRRAAFFGKTDYARYLERRVKEITHG